MKKVIATIAAFAVTAVSLFAASDPALVNDRPSKKPYHLGRLTDNVFVSVKGGVNTVLDNGTFAIGGPAVAVQAGKWLTPYTGVRFGWQGVRNRAADSANGWFSGEDAFSFNHIDADWMFDATAAIFGYRERIVNVRPFLRAGVIFTSYEDRRDTELGGGAGLDFQLRITRRLSVDLEAASLFAREEAWRGAGKVIAFPSLTAGVTCNLGKVGFDQHSDYVKSVPVEVVRDCGHDAQIKALKDEIARLKVAPAVSDTVEHWIGEGIVIYFTIDRWDLSTREEWHLKDLIDALPENATLHILGHADKETGSASRNRFLSEHRCETVAQALSRLGFKGTVTTEAFGDTSNPFNGNAPKNRCAVIRVSIPSGK